LRDSLYSKLQALCNRQEEISQSLADPDVIQDQNRFRELSKEYAQLNEVVKVFKSFQDTQQTIKNSEELIKDEDAEIRQMAEEEREEARSKQVNLEEQLQVLLLPQDPNDERNVFLEIRAGTGGNEAALFAGNLFRMYSRFAENKRWKMEFMSLHEGEQGGFKEVIVRIIGENAYSQMKFESGIHRVQRVPDTESQGRVHTSAVSVAVLPEMDEIENIDVNPSDLKVDTFRASGAGGQHVNVTDSAVRITHVPTGLVVECQDERSQHKNRARAMSLLSAKLLEQEREKQRAQEAQTRRQLVGSGDRSEKIRTYNYPQSRVTDHRINLTLYRLEAIMEGDLQELIDALIREHQADQLAALADERS